jgi:hypothetical protein
MTVSTRKQLHDHLLANKPEGVEHETCELCHVSENTPEGGAENMQTYTAEEVQAAVDAAVATLVAQVAELEGAIKTSEVAAAVEAVKAEAEAKILELQDALDVAVLEKQAAIDELAGFKADLEALEAARVEAEAVAAREEARLEQVRSTVNFTEEYLEANKARFAAMSDEDFETRLAEWAALSPKKESTSEGSAIPKTALTAQRESESSTTDKSLVRELMHASLLGDDIKTL